MRRAFLVAALLVVLALTVLFRPSGDPPKPELAEEPTVVPVPSEEAFCAAFLVMESRLREYVVAPDARGVELLDEGLADLVALGVPATMEPVDRGGLALVITDANRELGRTFDPQAVPGTVDLRDHDAARDAFLVWLQEYCPGWS